MTAEEAEVVQRALELSDMWDGVRWVNAGSAALRLYKAIQNWKKANVKAGAVC